MAPIEGSTPEEAADQFVRHINDVLGARSSRRDWHDILEASYRQFREEFAEFGTI